MTKLTEDLKRLRANSHAGSAIKEANRPTLTTFNALLDLTITLAEKVESMEQQITNYNRRDQWPLRFR